MTAEEGGGDGDGRANYPVRMYLCISGKGCNAYVHRRISLFHGNWRIPFLCRGSQGLITSDLQIFRRERLNGHYDAATFVIANLLSSAPFLLIISFIPAIIAYYLVGLQKDPKNFIYFALILYLSLLLVESLMMIIASIVPDFLMGIITGAGIQGGMLLAGGFFRLPKDLPKAFWKYPMHYAGFHRYVNQGLYKNEFLGLTFPSESNGGGNSSSISGMEVVRDYWQMQVAYSKWVDLSMLVGMMVLYRYLFWVTLKFDEAKLARQRNGVIVNQTNAGVKSSDIKSECAGQEAFKMQRSPPRMNR